MNNEVVVRIGPDQYAIDIELIKEEKELVNIDMIETVISDYLNSYDIDPVLQKIVDINKKYGNSWLQEGVFINFGDIKDKLTRLEIIVRNGEIEHKQETMDNYGNVIFDLFVRCLLTMILDRRVKEHVAEMLEKD